MDENYCYNITLANTLMPCTYLESLKVLIHLTVGLTGLCWIIVLLPIKQQWINTEIIRKMIEISLILFCFIGVLGFAVCLSAIDDLQAGRALLIIVGMQYVIYIPVLFVNFVLADIYCRTDLEVCKI